MGSSNTVTIIIIAITALASYYAWNNPHILSRWMLNPYQVQRNNQYDRFVTSGFIHNDMTHLFFNMFTLYFFGSVVETYFYQIFGTLGIVLYVALYVISIIVSDIPTFFKHRGQSYYNSLGASGGVSAIVFSAIVFQPTQSICLYFVLCVPGFILGALYLIYSMYKSRQPDAQNINHSAHFYGALFGFLATIILIPGAFSVFLNQLLNWNFQF